ncbi:hypothetical protein FKM82_022226 [Ascaphus truei]
MHRGAGPPPQCRRRRGHAGRIAEPGAGCILAAMGETARPQCYFGVEINREPIGRIVFQLFSDVCPKTCKNFLCLCTGEQGTGKTTGKKLCYKGSTFHRVVKNFMIQGGDFSEGNGKGGESIYGGYFKDENFVLKHDHAFLLSMANRGKHTNGSQFFITTKPAPHLDGVHVVFGLVISGFEVIEQIENLKTDAASRPYADVRVIDCGLLVAKPAKDVSEKIKRVASHSEVAGSSSKSSSPSSSSSSSESSSESEIEIERNRRKKRKRGTTKPKPSKRRKKEQSRRHETTEKRPPSQPSTHTVKNNLIEEKDSSAVRKKPVVRPEEIPPVPENRFLLRRDAPALKPEPETKPVSVQAEQNDQQQPSLSKSGRKIRGRGTIRYHTPPRSRSQSESVDDESSETPPYWKEEMQRLRAYKPPTGEKWSKGDKLTDSFSSRWDDRSLSRRSRSWSHDGNRSDASRERGSRSKNRKKEKKLKHKKKSKKLKHSKKHKPPKKDPLPLPEEESPRSSSRRKKSSHGQIKRSSSVLSRCSSKKNLIRSAKEQYSSVHSSKESRSYSRSGSSSYSRGSLRSRTASKSSSHSRSGSRSRSQTKSRSRNRTKSRSRSNSQSHSSKSKQGKTVSRSPKTIELPSVEIKPVVKTEPGKPVVHSDKLVLPSVAPDKIPVMPLSDSPPPSRWKPGQKPWKPSYERIPDVKVKASVLPTQSRYSVRDVKVGSYKKRRSSSDSEDSYSGSSAYRRKSKLRSSRSRSYSRSYTRSRSRSSSRSRSGHRSHSHTSHSSSYERSSSYDSSDDKCPSSRSLLKSKRKTSKSPNHSQKIKVKESISRKSRSQSNSCSSSDSEPEDSKKSVLKTTTEKKELENHDVIKPIQETDVHITNSNMDQQKSRPEQDGDTDSVNALATDKEQLVDEQIVKSDEMEENQMAIIQLETVSEQNENVHGVEDARNSSGKEEGEASSESDTETTCQSKTKSSEVLSPLPSANIPEKLTKTPPSASSSLENSKSKSKKRKHRSSKKSLKKNHLKKGKEKSKKRKDKKRKIQKRKQTFHWQPPLEFGEEEEDETVTGKPDVKHKVNERKDLVHDDNKSEGTSRSHKNTTNAESPKVNIKPCVEQGKSVNPLAILHTTEEREYVACTNKSQMTTAHVTQIVDANVKMYTPDRSSNHSNVGRCSPGGSKASASIANSDTTTLPSTSIVSTKEENVPVKVEKTTLSNQPVSDKVTSLGKVKVENTESIVVDHKWKPVQGQSHLQVVKPPSIPLSTPSEQEKKPQGLRMEIKSKNKVRPGSLFDEVRKTARLNQRPRNQESSSEEGSSSQDEKSLSRSETRSRSKSRSGSRHRTRSLSYSRSRSRSRSYSHSSRSRSRSRRHYSRYTTRSRSRSCGSYKSHRAYIRSRSRSPSYGRRRRSRSRSHTYDSTYSRSPSRSRSCHRARSYDRRSRYRPQVEKI